MDHPIHTPHLQVVTPLVLDPTFAAARASWLGGEVLLLKDSRGVGGDALAVEAAALEAVAARRKREGAPAAGRRGGKAGGERPE